MPPGESRRVSAATVGTVRLRHATSRDIEAVYAVEVSSFSRPYPPAYLSILLALGSHFIVAEHEGRIVGYVVAIDLEGSVCHVLSIAVAPGYRGRGIGRKLLGKVLEECCRSGSRTGMLEVSAANYAAQRLYLEAGFRYYRVLPRYYGDDDALLMVSPDICARRKGG